MEHLIKKTKKCICAVQPPFLKKPIKAEQQSAINILKTKTAEVIEVSNLHKLPKYSAVLKHKRKEGRKKRKDYIHSSSN